jgi:hypothetical protein
MSQEDDTEVTLQGYHNKPHNPKKIPNTNIFAGLQKFQVVVRLSWKSVDYHTFKQLKLTVRCESNIAEILLQCTTIIYSHRARESEFSSPLSTFFS